MIQNCLPKRFYAWEAIKEITPITSRIGNATEVSPAITSPIKINGKNIMVNNIFMIPHDAFMANTNSFPNTTNIKITNNAVNIFIVHLSLFLFREIGKCPRVPISY